MDSFFASGHVADLILVILVVEAAALAVWHRRTGQGPRPGVLIPNLLAGGTLVLALRTALTGAGWMWTGAALAAALLAHLWDLAARWRG